MARTRKDEAPVAVEGAVLEGRYVDLGGYTASFETFHVDADGAAAFRGLPDDRCQCPHWGMVIAGPYVLRYEDHEEHYDTGDVFYAPPGHTPVVAAGTEIVHFSPSAELGATMAAVAANLRVAATS